MKKFLSILLSALMLVLPLCETAVFAAPSAVYVVDTAVEAPIVDVACEEETLLAADITYTVSFNANGGSGAPLSQKKIKGKNLVLKDTMPVRDGYTFAGWSTSKDASVGEYVPGGIYSSNKSVTLYAVWSDEFNGMESVGVQYRVVATPYSHVSGEEPTYTTGYDCLFLEKTGGTANSYIAPMYVYVTPDDLGIDGENLDDYILSEFSIIAVIEEYNDMYSIHTVLVSQNNMSKKTVTELELCEVDSNNESSYFYDEDYNLTQAKLLSGRVKIGGTDEEFYVFNAPHSYASPVIDPSYDIADKYYARNEYNIRGLYGYSYYSNGNKITEYELLSLVEYPNSYQIEEEYFYDQAYQLAEMFSTVYYGGQYEADLYDVNGDGLYDYIDYKPYAFFRADADEDEYFEDSDFFAEEDDNVFPYIYTNGATVIGEDFNNGDYVIGYFSMDNETVKIADVVKPTVDLLAGYRTSAGTLTLGNGDTVSVTGAYKLLANMYPVDEYGDKFYGIVFDHEKQFENDIMNCCLFDRELIGKQLEFYVYDGVLLHASKADSTLKYTGNLIIPTDLYFEYEYDGYLYNTNYNINGDEDITCYPEEAFDAESGKVWYIYAWVDGKAKYVPVNTVDCEPTILQHGELAPEYRDKLCTYTVDEDGIYTITSLGYDVDDYDSWIYTGVNRDGLDGEYDNYEDYAGFDALNDEKDSTLQYYADGLDGEIYKIAGTRYSIGGFERYVDIKSNTLIIIREFDIINQCFTYVISDGSTFVKSPSLYEDAVYTNISLIVENNPDSKSRENLLLLYAETTNTSKKPDEPEYSYEFDFPENIIIPTDLYFEYTYVDEDGEEYWYDTEESVFDNYDEIVRFPERSFDGELGKVWYVYAWVDGEMKYVPVKNDVFDRVIDSWGYISDEYRDKICTYTIDEDGFYVIKSVGYETEYDEDIEDWIYISQDISSINDTTDSTLLYYSDNMAGSICNIIGKRYEVADFDREVVLTDESRIIIRVFDIEEQEFEYAEYDAETFFGSDRDAVFTNISFILKNDPSSKTKENLLVLYAETTDTAYLKEKTEQEEPVYEFNFPENIIIPTDLYYEYSFDDGYGYEEWYNTTDMVFGNNDEIVRFPEEAFDGEAGKVWYIYAWVDGETKYVPINVDASDPRVVSRGDLNEEFNNKICTYTIDEDGLYVIKSLGYAEDGIEKEDISVLNNDTDDSIMFFSDGNTGTIEKMAGSRFNISGFDRAVDFVAETKIIIRVFDIEEQEFEYRVFDAESFTKSLDDNVELTNMSYIVRNNIDSKAREKLVVLYAETTELTFKGINEENSERVVSDYYIGQDENGLWRFYYELYDPYTGKFVSDVPSDYGVSKASYLDLDEYFEIGSIISLRDGMVNHSASSYLGFADNNKLVYFKEVDVEDGYFSVVNYNDVACASYDGDRLECGVDCKICIRDYVEENDGYVYDFIHDSEIVNGYDEPTSYIRFDENTVVSVITKSGSFDTAKIWTGSKANLSDMSKIASKNKSLLCRNNLMKDRYGNYMTGYSEYVKAYVSVVDEGLDKGEIPLAKFVIVVVNDNEYAALNNGCYDHDPVENEPQITTGDLNEDDAVDVNDAILLLQHSMFPELYPIDYPGDIDFTGDGNIDMNDAILLLQHSMFPELYPIE